MGFTVVHNHTVTYQIDGELRPDEVDRLNGLIAAHQELADALNAAQNKENVPVPKDPMQCGGLCVSRKSSLVTPAKAPLGLQGCAGNASYSPTSIDTTPLPLPLPKLISSLPSREILPSVLVRSSSLAPTDEPSQLMGHHENHSQFGDEATDTMSTTCVADSEICSRISPESRNLCLRIGTAPTTFQPVWVKRHITIADLRLQIKGLTGIPPYEQVLLWADPKTLRNQELKCDGQTVEAVSSPACGQNRGVHLS
jgi:hypothetical protein